MDEKTLQAQGFVKKEVQEAKPYDQVFIDDIVEVRTIAAYGASVVLNDVFYPRTFEVWIKPSDTWGSVFKT